MLINCKNGVTAMFSILISIRGIAWDRFYVMEHDDVTRTNRNVSIAATF